MEPGRGTRVPSKGVAVPQELYRACAIAVLAVHAAYIGAVVLGVFFTRGRPRLAAAHVAALAWGVCVEAFDFWCPLTMLENRLEARGGVSPYGGPFLLHYLDALVYPNLSATLLTAGSVAFCVFNLFIYARRFLNHRSLG